MSEEENQKLTMSPNPITGILSKDDTFVKTTTNCIQECVIQESPTTFSKVSIKSLS